MFSRRQLLGTLAAIGSVTGLGRQVGAQTLAPHHQKFAEAAQAMLVKATKAGDQAFGAVVVKDGKIIGYGPSRVVSDQDATAHAEMTAIRAASKSLGTGDLGGCVLYSTSPPCAMCATGAYWAGIDRVYSGDPLRDLGPPRYGC